jgi:hypothetical protein
MDITNPYCIAGSDDGRKIVGFMHIVHDDGQIWLPLI